MLTRELAIVDYRDSRAVPDRLRSKSHGHYTEYARRMCDVYAAGIGRMRSELHRDVRALFSLEPDCPLRRIDAFCKLLDEVSEYDRDSSGKAAKLREKVFRAAAEFHPLVSVEVGWFQNAEQKVKAQVASQLGLSWEEIDQRLFADIMEFHRLKQFDGYADPKYLLARYNVAQTQVAMYDATTVTIWAKRDFKMILRYAKLARLMHRISRVDQETYRFDLNGPASLFHHTQRYGVSMARFLPGLLACREWRLQALLRPPRWQGRVVLELDSGSGLSSSAPAATDFDSQLEQKFAEAWGDEEHDGWRLFRETEILQEGQTVFMPDFVFQHQSGQRALMEVVGFWTPEYLKHKQATLQQFHRHQILLAVAESLKEKFIVDYPNSLVFKTAIKVDAVVQLLNRLR